MRSCVKKTDVAIIGGGITGLATAHRLHEACLGGPQALRREPKGPDFILLESASRAGGVIETCERDGFLIEKGPDAIFSGKPSGLALLFRLGLRDEIISTNARFRKVFIALKGKLVPLPQGFHLFAPRDLGSLFKSPLLSIPGKLRAMGEPLIPPARADSDESLASFIRRRFGSELYQKIAQPMITAIYGGDPQALSIRSTLSSFYEYERQKGSVFKGLLRSEKHRDPSSQGPRYGWFMTLKKGLGDLVRALEIRLGNRLLLESPVHALKRNPQGRGWMIYWGSGQILGAKTLVLTLPCHPAARLLQEEAPKLACLLNRVPYESALLIHFAFRRDAIAHPLDGFGFIVPKIEGSFLIGCSFSSVKFEGRVPEGHVLLRVFANASRDPGLFEMNDPDLVKKAAGELAAYLSIREKPLFYEVTRLPNSMPQYGLGHEKLISEIEDEIQRVGDLVLAGGAFRGVGIPDCIAQGEACAERILEHWGRSGISEPVEQDSLEVVPG